MTQKESEPFLLLGIKSRRLILTMIKWRWHGVRWEMITRYTSVPNHHCRLKCMQRNSTLHFSKKCFRMLCCCAKKKKKKKWEEKKRNVHVRDSFGSTQKRWALNINLFSSPAGGCRSKPAICHNAPLKWLKMKICTCTGGVDHRITVSVAANQCIGFYLGCPKWAHVSNTTEMHLGGGVQKMIKKPSFCEATRDFCFGWETTETRKKKRKTEKKLKTHQQSQWFALKKEENTPKQVDLLLWKAVLMMFAWMSELGKNTETVTSHQWCRSTRAHFSSSITFSHREDGISIAAAPSDAQSSGVAGANWQRVRLLRDWEFGLVFRVAAIPGGDAVNFNAAAFQVLKGVGVCVGVCGLHTLVFPPSCAKEWC